MDLDLINFTLVLMILSIVNYFIFKRGPRLDLTEMRLNSLTNSTLKVVNQVKEQIRVNIIAKP